MIRFKILTLEARDFEWLLFRFIQYILEVIYVDKMYLIVNGTELGS